MSSSRFEWDGKHWQISWNDIALPSLDDLEGLRIIQWLIRHPGESFPVLNLVRCLLDRPICEALESGYEEMTTDAWDEIDELFVGSSTEVSISGEAPEAHRKLVEKANALRKKLASFGGELHKDSVLAEAELVLVKSMLLDDYDSVGRPRWESAARQKAHSRVNQLLRKAYSQIQLHSQPSAYHLRNNIKMDHDLCSYDPDSEINWNVGDSRSSRGH